MSLERLARLCYRRRWRVLGLWILLLVGVNVANRNFGEDFSNAFELPGTESARAFELLEERFPQQAGDTAFIVFKAEPTIFTPQVREPMEQLFERVRANPSVIEVASPYEGGFFSVGGDDRIAIAQVQLRGGGPELDREDIRDLQRTVAGASTAGIQVELGGRSLPFAENSGPGDREFIGIIAAIVILLISFGSLIAMGLPILTAIFGLGIGLTLLGLLNRLVDAPEFTGQLATMIGLGVGIDYALFIVTRYRQTLHAGATPEAAVITSITTAGRAVIFAGLTVVISVMGMFLMGLAFVRGLAIGAALVVLMTVFASITLLPAILGFTGHAIDRLRVPFLHRDESAHRHTIWFRWSRVVQRYPWPAAIASLVVLLVLATPVLSIRLGFSDASTTAEDSSARRAFDLLAEGFGPGFNGPLMIVAEVESTSARSKLDEVGRALQTTEGVRFAAPPRVNPAGDTAVLMLFPTTGPQDERTEGLIRRLRSDVLPRFASSGDLTLYVGSPTALFVDMSAVLGRRLPLFITGVIGLSFLLLLVVFRSVLVPLKAALMNVLGIGAAFGMVVAIFQWGWGDSILGSGSGPIEPFIPMMLFAILFGLSMDYEVFLLSRVREEYLRSGDNAVAVADGLAATARVITAAAAIMVTLFLSFVSLGDFRVIKIFGLGLALAIFLDATLIRLVLVPSTMELLGNANWWLPSWLGRLLPRVAIESHSDEEGIEVTREGHLVLDIDDLEPDDAVREDVRVPVGVGAVSASLGNEPPAGGNGGRRGIFGRRRRGRDGDDIEELVSSAVAGDELGELIDDDDDDEDLVEIDLSDADEDDLELSAEDDDEDDEGDDEEELIAWDQAPDEDEDEDEEELELSADDDDEEELIAWDQAPDEDEDEEELELSADDDDEEELIAWDQAGEDEEEDEDEDEVLVLDEADDEDEILVLDEDDEGDQEDPVAAPAPAALVVDEAPEEFAASADEEADEELISWDKPAPAVAEGQAEAAGDVGGLLDWDQTGPQDEEDEDSDLAALDDVFDEDDEDDEDEDELETTSIEVAAADIDEALSPIEDVEEDAEHEAALAAAPAASSSSPRRFGRSGGRGRRKSGPVWEHHADRANT